MNKKCEHMNELILWGQGHPEQAAIPWNDWQNMWEKKHFTKGVVMP